MKIGAHQSIAGGFHKAIDRGKYDACESIQIFTKAPGVWKGKPIDSEAAESFIHRRKEESIGPILVHDAYLINPCSNKPSLRTKSWEALSVEAQRCDQLGAEYLVMHPGSSSGVEESEALQLIASAVDLALHSSEQVTILLENTAGQGNSLGYRFEHLAEIIDRVENKARVGVCIDTCHAFAAGYDLRTISSAQDVFQALEQIIPLSKTLAFHLNDSKRPLGSRVDRHALIGQGEIGIEFFRWLMQESKFDKTPGILETPIPKGDTYAVEISLLKELCNTP